MCRVHAVDAQCAYPPQTITTHCIVLQCSATLTGSAVALQCTALLVQRQQLVIDHGWEFPPDYDDSFQTTAMHCTAMGCTAPLVHQQQVGSWQSAPGADDDHPWTTAMHCRIAAMSQSCTAQHR